MKRILTNLWNTIEEKRKVVIASFDEHKENRIDTGRSLFDPIFKEFVTILNNQFVDILDDINKIIVDEELSVTKSDVIRNNNTGSKLTIEFLKINKFVRENREDRDDEKFTVWIRNGITIYETDAKYEKDKKPKFLYATYIKGDGSFKGGFTIDTDIQLNNLFYSLTNRQLNQKDKS